MIVAVVAGFKIDPVDGAGEVALRSSSPPSRRETHFFARHPVLAVGARSARTVVDMATDRSTISSPS
jgi:hypothetical protein